jgi:hypothetical protein
MESMDTNLESSELPKVSKNSKTVQIDDFFWEISADFRSYFMAVDNHQVGTFTVSHD